jgi:ABC-type bacteriocin/lantibiotic exporter with double-glycine peptidase domain
MSVVDYDDGSRIIQNVPICYQGNTTTCAQACITSVLNYWGYRANYADIIRETSNADMSVGMTPERIIWYLRRNNLKARSYKGNLDNLKNLVDAGLPTIVVMDEKQEMHVIVVIGYNDYRQLIFYIDSMNGDILEEPYSDFARAWSRKRTYSTQFYSVEDYSNMLIEVSR